MLALELNLLLGRYHATPWGRAANEGQPEWPPSPWRVGRALVSAWWRAGDTRPTEETMEAVLALLGPPPRFLLPRGLVAHTRHYVPLGTLEDGAEETTLVFDPFVRTASEPVAMIWDDAEIDEEMLSTIGNLLERVGYLGRAESSCLITATADPPRLDGRLEANPATGSEKVEEIVSVLCLIDQPRLGALSEATAELRRRRVKGHRTDGSCRTRFRRTRWPHLAGLAGRDASGRRSPCGLRSPVGRFLRGPRHCG